LAKASKKGESPTVEVRSSELAALADLKPHPRNYKKHPAAQIAHIAQSLRDFGFYRNVVVARDGTVLAGHGVVQASRKVGLAQVPVVRLDLDPLDPRALKVVALDNEVARLGEADDGALAALLKDVAAAGELLGTGHDDASLALLLAGAHVDEPRSDPHRVVEVSDLRAPFPWFGGKSRAAPIIWGALGEVENYVEPFAGSLAVLLSRPGGASGVETVNDLDAWVANFWRATALDPEAVARHADWPVNESDLHARHGWLLKQEEWRRRMRDPDEPDFFDARVAGWWVWGCCLWIGSGWCDERLMRAQVRDPHLSKGPTGVHAKRMSRPSQKKPHLQPGSRGPHANRVLGPSEQIPHLSTSGVETHAAPQKLPFLGHGGRGVHRPEPSEQLPFLGHAGRGVHRALASEQLPHLQPGSRGEHRESLDGGSCAATAANLRATFDRLRDRLRRVRVACGDWERVLTGAVTTGHGLTGIVLDPPYSEGADNLYGNHDKHLSSKVRQWAVEHGSDPQLRIAFCGYDGEHAPFPDGWRCVAWKAQGGYGSGNGNPYRERIWLSPGCLKVGDEERKTA